MRKFFACLLLFGINLLAQKPAGTLPVELVYFQGYFAESKVILFWGTATEVNNYGFEVERRTPQQNWEVSGFVLGSGNSNSPKSYYYEDSTNLEQSIYYYRLKQIDNDGATKYSDSVEISTITSVKEIKKNDASFSLEQNFPNPFNPSTTITYSIGKRSVVTLIVYDVGGVEITALVNEEKEPGIYSVTFDASYLLHAYGDLPSGIYFYKLTAGETAITKKFLLLK